MALATINSLALAALPTDAKRIAFNAILGKSTGGFNDPFEGLIGPVGGQYPVIRATDLEAQSGQVVKFTNRGVLKGMGQRSANRLLGKEEAIKLGTDDVRIAFVRHATGWDRETLQALAVGKSLVTAAAMMLDDWLGRTRYDFITQRARMRCRPGTNVFFPSSARGTIAAMTSADTLSTGLINRSAALLNQVQAKPLSMTKMPLGVRVAKYVYLVPDSVAQPLLDDSDYLAAAKYELSADAGDKTLRSGGFATWRGHGIWPVNTGNDDGNGPTGSFLNPTAKLGNAIAAGTAALTLTGGGSLYTASTSDQVYDYFRYFPGNVGYTQYSGESITEYLFPIAATDDYFVKIFNHVESTAGAGDQGKWGFYRYIGSAGVDATGSTIATAPYSATTGRGGGRLSGTANGGSSTEHTTVGTVVWDSTLNTVAHPVGAPMYLANKSGQCMGGMLAFGADAFRIAYGGGAGGKGGGSIAGTKYDETQDYGMQIAAAIEAVMGVEVRLDTSSLPRGYVYCPLTYVPVGV